MSFLNLDSTDKTTEADLHEEPRLPTRRGSDSAPTQKKTPDRPFPSFFARIFSVRPDHSARKPRRWLRRTFVVLTLLICFGVAGLVGTSVWLRQSMRAALPQLDGSLHVAGLQSSVTVSRDTHGVPSIQAANLDDLLFAQGFVTAQDRLWQMDALRRHAAGELAEILGSKVVEHDRLQRVLQIRATAERAVAALPPDQLHQLQAYANGVNAFITQNEDRLPIEFRILHYRPAQWTPRDTILVSLSMFQDLGTQFPVKMKREALTSHLAPELISELYPVGSWRDRPPTQPQPDLTTPKPAIEEIPLDDTQVKLQLPQKSSPEDVLRVANETQTSACNDCVAGSNNWAVSGARSASGFPLLSNDMHLALNAPDIWYQAGLHCPSGDSTSAMDVVGFTLPGAPFVIVGQNAHVAWGFTNLAGDVQDVRIEHTRTVDGAMEYQKANGSWATVEHHAEVIRVRGGHDVTIDVPSTTAKIGSVEIMTPVISQLYPSEHRTLSLAWTPYDPANLEVPFFAANKAKDGQALVSAFTNFGGPSLNLIYADDAKHIGYHAIGRIPVRGPMERKARLISPLITDEPKPKTEEVPETEEQEATKPQAHLSAPMDGWFTSTKAGLLDAAFRPTRRKAVPRREAPPQEEKPKEEPIKPLPLPIDYTIGSPISPVPVDALDIGQQWSGYIPFQELPAAVDPANGILATANARITADDYPYYITNNWAAPYRAERILKLLAGKRHLTTSNMLAIQNDIHSEFDLLVAQRLVYALDHASQNVVSKDARRLHQAADILRDWNGDMSVDSSAAAIVTAFRRVIWPMLLLPKIEAHDHLGYGKAPKELVALYQWGGQTVAFESMLQHSPRHWLPRGVSNWDDMLALAVIRSLDEARAPDNLSKWRYGADSTVEISHPVLSQSSILRRLLGTSGGSGKHETSGDVETIKAISQHFGPSERFDADLSGADATLGNITTGQSGNPASPWYIDQFLPWLHGTSSALPLHPAEGQHTLTLTP